MSVDTISFTRRNLPHWEVYGKSYFVTFRLRGSLPNSVVAKLKSERDAILSGEPDSEGVLRFQRYEFAVIEKILDSVHNDHNAFLTSDNIAPILMNSLEFLENKYCWRFPSFVVMPNHVHCLCLPDKEGEKIKLTDVIGLFKRYTATIINKLINRTGRMWVDENFDHWCRSPAKEEQVKRYIRMNPVKAGFVKKVEDWRWGK